MTIPYYGLQAGDHGGHYESWFVRANHPSRPLAIWIRYTLFRAADERPALGEVWAVYSDGEKGQTTALKEEFPLADCHFGRDGMDICIGDNRLIPGQLTGQLQHRQQHLAWSLDYDEGQAPLLLLPAALYDKRLPKAKSLVSRPGIAVNGTLTLDGETLSLQQWRGSENHNWGSQHTDRYAWGQVAGFDNAPDVFLECATAQVKLGPIHTPKLTVAALRVGDQTLLFNRPLKALAARAHYQPFRWQLNTACGQARLTVHMHSRNDRVAALTYYNPPGGNKICLNSKLAQVTATLRLKGQPDRVLHSAHGGAFEILTDTLPDGMGLQV
ncbi:hypothetical protein A11A3_08530 [Alcanivorax hongdengensis A-11-3]|uniref:Tocopherol cyclase n=1 Tax=Alcanivorax hongdengensis A-11-3 TaxID=1177179 RepID=L0WCH4_9GAMM|nr:hypothetical protein [Alcanivorax hongdengensis]EKF74453.1 hypothetical protein A11A3_08530 [Alcanivorax hongdengensis A-11-3]